MVNRTSLSLTHPYSKGRGLWLCALLLLSACHEQERVLIDGSSKDAFEKSSAKARRTIPDADRLVFDRAIRTIGGRRFGNGDPDALARTTFDGMTAAQVVADQRAHEQGRE